MKRFRAYALCGWLLCAFPTLLAAQSVLRGKVLVDVTERPLPGVVVSIVDLKMETTTDSAGNFFIGGVAPGAHLISVRKIGFGPLSSRLTFGVRDTVEADLLMESTTAQSLPDANVVTAAPVSAKLAEFEERRLSNRGGQFITQAQLEKRQAPTLADALRPVPGIGFLRGANDQGWYAITGRGRTSFRSATCYVAVMIDGTFVYGMGNVGEPKFDLNSVNPNTLAGVEYYTGTAAMPIKYNATRATCGLLVLWTK